jgi:mycofactocin system glycosyltransferase
MRPSANLRTASDGKLLLGGSPLRLLTLTTRGTRLVAAWSVGRPVGDARDERLLARRLLDAGLFDSAPPLSDASRAELTIVVPVHARSDQLRACLAALSGRWPVIVVDDGSPNADAIAAEAQRAGAKLVRHPTNLGVSAARNTGLRLATTPVVAFLDSDCVPSPGFPGKLLAHLEDPAVGMVAPRIVSPAAQRGRIAEYERLRSALDMGAQPSLARPYGRVWYVPSAAMVARREALGCGFDEGLKIGEDVDLVWRLHDAGWQTRYDPRVSVAHTHRIEPVAWYRRRVFYNSSVAPLRLRHPTRLPLMYLTPPSAIAWSAALAAAPASITVLAAARVRRRRTSLAPRFPGATRLAIGMSIGETVHEGRELARALAGPWSPLALAAVLMPRRRGTARRLAALFAAWLLSDWLTDRPTLDPLTYCLLRLADESARGVGIWQGCIQARDFRSLLAARPPRSDRR